MMLLSFPEDVPVEKRTFPPCWILEEAPLMMQYLTVLAVASPINLMVDVPAEVDALELAMVRPAVDPVRLTLPSITTLSAPFRLITGLAARLPSIFRSGKSG